MFEKKLDLIALKCDTKILLPILLEGFEVFYQTFILYPLYTLFGV
jgi:hypothetical protein